jgi:hypothetical protein
MENPILKQGNAQGPETARSFLENVVLACGAGHPLTGQATIWNALAGIFVATRTV